MVDISNIEGEEKAAMDAQRFEQPIPGSSMTEDPENPAPYSRAPEFSNVDKALEFITDMITSEEKLDGLTDSLMQGAPADGLARVIVEQGFAKGKWNPDIAILLAEPVTYLILSIGELVGAEPQLSGDAEDEEDSSILNNLSDQPDEVTPDMLSDIKESVNG